MPGSNNKDSPNPSYHFSPIELLIVLITFKYSLSSLLLTDEEAIAIWTVRSNAGSVAITWDASEIRGEDTNAFIYTMKIIMLTMLSCALSSIFTPRCCYNGPSMVV